ncbi:uncharacterized protein nid2a isoform X2 [Hippocampus comes]|uniref:uncharacterized protein nid2a isoform X2 n=1 Tax=Hippocampus comes TaxID=109280 RepID=UPI00094E115E|nr:PREDICTED: nidogen-2 isoform X2 [Hippocampus comes]
MERGQMVTVYLLGLCCSMCAVAAIPRAQMFPYGMLSGDSLLEEGDDETSKVISLPKPFYFYDTPFYQLYVATNGFISAQDLPMETQYVDDGFPTDFPVVAPFLADMDTSGGRGQIFYRVTETPSVLNRVAQEVRRGFPDAEFTPTHAVVATWENVAAYEEPARTSGGTSNKVNTFQAVIGYDESDSYALFLYPEGGLNFFGTRPKESFKVAIELAARVGFSRGEVSYLYFSRTEGPHYSVTSDEQSIKRLTQVGNTGIPGLWLFHTGNRYFFDNIVPASTGGILATPLPREHDHTLGATTPEYNDFEEYEDNSNFEPAHQEEDGDFPLTGEDLEFRPAVADETLQSRSSDLPLSASEVSHGGEDLPLTSEPRHGSEVAERQYAPPPPPPPQEATPDGGAQWSQEQRPQIPVEVGRLYPPRRNEPPLSSGGHVVSVEEDVDFDTGVIHYTTENKETCARFKQQCSQNAFCSDYATGFCCHCQPGFYGNGRHCLPEAAPQRVSGKLSGTVTVGLTPVELNNIDLHAYIVVGDGRAYTAVSEIPEPVGWALMPAAPIGELFGWLFALELPNSQAGFKTTGAEFTRHAELVFYPGNQRLLISQTGRGLDENNHFTVDTVLSGSIPFLPPAAEVTMDPFKETYHYYPSVATSNSVREFTVVSPDGGSESFSFQLKQNITYRDCRHDSRVPPLETQQITMERVFVMYVKEERILRYAITNKISPVGGPELVNPCYDGSHDCDTTAQCIPLEDKAFQCRCGTGYSGDGHNCQDIDECAEGLSTCGAHSQCINLPGSHRCRCQAGYEFGFDGRTCVDMDECRSSPCHGDARCTNSLGSFQCQCQNGFYGDGFLCSQQGQTDRTKSQCEEHRDRLQGGLEQAGQLPVGIFVPQCDSDGRYRPLQCHGSTGHCWCVDSRGQERAGTRTPPGTAPTDCDRHEQPQQPKTQCEHHRDSIQTTSPEGYPIVGAFVPQCDANGRYTPQQCHGSTGHCWCVDSQGQERHGTRTPPGTTPIDCERPDDRPKTHCEQHRDSVQTTSPLVGAFVPQCDANGQYTPLQCHGSTGHCWCVDSQGQERPRTRTSPGAPPTDCDKPDEPDRTKTHCERHRDSVQTTSPEGFPLVGAFVPQCDANGQYTPQQCHGSTGHCWCVDNRGQERPGTRTSAGSTPVDCDKPEQPKTQCEQHRDSIQTISPEGYPVVGSFVPQCDSSGHYTPLQCHGSTGHCWCVDSQGQERVGTRTLPGTTPTNCDKPEDPERLKTHCEQHRDSVQTTSPEGYPILGAFVPQCDANGQYTPQQCHGSSGHCWCVDNRGQERPGTRTPPGATPVDCAKPERPKSHCELHRDGTQTEGPEGYPPVGAFVPQCDANGHYTPQQCHGSSGHCWCVDSQGQERSGTRTPPGATPFDCEKAERPRSHCELHRDRIHTTSPEGYPLAGAFVPQCDANGQYIHQQCHGSSGHCWCVDSQGQERPGTRTPPGATPFDCDKPEQPKTQCEQHRDSIQTISPEGYPVVGSFVPQCDSSGHYTPLQCHGSTGHCWCVDSQGQERVGTRTLPGTTPTNCDKPEDPERLKTHCEQHRDSVQTTSPEGYPILGAFVPQCDANGQYTPQQCHGSSGHCWCVDNRGQERPGTRTPPGATPVDCAKPERPKSHCELHRDGTQTEGPEGYPPVGAFVPQCDANGHYTPQQCHGSSGHCWCVDSQGQERSGTRTPPGATPFDCEKAERPRSHCELHRDRIHTTSPEGYPLAGAFVPQCDANGQYIHQQCHGSSGHCWCVDSQGQERPGTRTPPGATPFDCDKPERPKSHCEHLRDSIQTTSPEGHQLAGAYVPQCDANGHYTPQQCHGSTGHCWCVDTRGQERPGTRTPPGATPINCDKPDCTKTHCERHRDRVQTTSPDGHPLVGVYVPHCDANGQYTPQQCRGSSGHCWCVDSQGQERPGTRTPPGTTPFDCDQQERPRSHCELHRDSIQTTSPEGHPLAGAYVPQCDANGNYTPQQCHGSSGHCWCVDSQGQERSGTRTPPGATPFDCEKPERPKSHCEQHRESIQTTSPEGHQLAGAYVPECDNNGHYTSRQCHGSTGHCWCVDSQGQERPGTRTPPGATPFDCDKPERPKSHCEQHRESIQTTSPEGHQLAGAYVPQCDANGHYTPQQCHGSTGHCWCVDSQGQERPGTRTPPGTTPFDCDQQERPKSHCEQHRESIQTTSPEGHQLAGAYVPECDNNGHYTSRQCHGSTGHCWCVDSQGQERPGTRTPPGATPFDCDKPERPKSHCEQHRESIQTTSPEGHQLAGAYVPQCDANGHYTPQQCHGSTGHCWCVDSQGQERPGTRTPPGTTPIDCDKPEPPRSHCEQHRDSVQTTSPDGYPILGAFIPQCDANGQYTPQQCHGSSGHCWCVDNQGQERPGTRTPPGATPFNCDKQERPQTHCEQHRDRAQATGPEGKPIPGAYIPHCDTNGRYTSQQCHGSTGHCWCVDSHGQERPGTRTPPGTTPIDCERPNQRPKTHCEHHRASVQTTSPEGYPLVGAFVPQCDAHGQYTPQQCHGSIGQCWCVDSNGQERAGTRTPSGVPPVDCDAPVYAAPTERPESVCERWRSSLMEHYGGKPEPQQYLPQCEPDGQFSPIQCYGETTYCWCVDQDGREVPGTRSNDVVKPACLPSVAPPTVRPLPRPDVTPPSHTDVTLLYAQGQKIGALPLNGSRLDASRSRTLLTLHGSIVVGLSYDCKQNQVYWTDLSARTINRASMVPGAEPEILINSNLVSPEGLAVDVNRRLMFWVDSNPDLIERSNLDGSDRRTLFDRDLVNPRAIIVVSSTGSLYWTDWNREAPKIESASVDGQNRRVVVSEGIGLPNALTYDYSSGHICWADAGTKRLECVFPDGSRRRVINPSLNYPFSMVYHRNHFYYTDWRRDGVITVSKDSGKLTDEYLPDQRSHLYGIAIATSHCLSGNH